MLKERKKTKVDTEEKEHTWEKFLRDRRKKTKGTNDSIKLDKKEEKA